MSPRFWVLAGLLSGVLTGLTILALAVIYGPEPGIARVTASPLPVPTATATLLGGGSPAPGGSPAGPAASATGSTSPTATTTVMHIGQPAPVLVVPQVGGGTIDLATLRGRPVWILFLNTACSACVQQLSLMNGYLSRYSASGLVVLGVDVRDEEGAVSNFAKRAGVSFPFGLDLEGGAQHDWEAGSFPAHYWIDASGVVRDAAPGVIPSDRMAVALRLVLPGVDVQP